MTSKLKYTKTDDPRGEVLVALLPSKADFGILQEQGWYRIPVRTAPKRWPPKWLAFYQPKAFAPDHFRIRYYGKVADIQVMERRVLFPNELPSAKSEQKYYKLSLETLEELPEPILSDRPRRLVFVQTTWQKFSRAEQLNDLFDASPLEDLMWREFKRLKIRAERQWTLILQTRRYHLDFALFCNDGHIDVEMDGDTWHAVKGRIPLDNQRDNDIESSGWHVLRFNGKQIREAAQDECVPSILKTIDTLGGLTDEGLVSRIFYTTSSGTAEQLTLFEGKAEYHVDSGAAYNLELD